MFEEAHGKQRACILICDITRPVPNGLILKSLIRQLRSAGITSDQIQILVATGLHRPNHGEELREIVGDDWVFDHICIQNHYARNDRDHKSLGQTSMGTPVKLDRRFLEVINENRNVSFVNYGEIVSSHIRSSQFHSPLCGGDGAPAI